MRAWLKIFVVGVAVVALAVAALPLWLGPVLRLAGRPLHLRFGSYHAVSYGQFELRDAVYEHGPVKVSVGWARIDTPAVWLWRHWRGRDVRAQASDWHVLVRRSTTATRSTKPVGISPLHDQLEKIAGALRRWLPRAHVERGRVDWPGGGFSLAQADWDVGTLRAKGLAWAAGSANVTAAFPLQGPVRVDVEEADRGWRAALTWTGPAAGGQAWAWNQPLHVQARYGNHGWMPVHAEIHAVNWSVPTPQSRVGAWYPAVSGNCDVTWDRGAFAVRIRAKAASQQSHLPPLDIDVEAEGNRAGWAVDALQIAAPFAQVHLSRPVRFHYGGMPDAAGAELRFDVNLGGIGGLGATGRVSGSAMLTGEGPLPIVQVNIAASQAGWGRIPPGDFQLSGRFDVRQRTVAQGRLQGRWSGDALRRALPSGATAEAIEMNATADGPLDALRHQGNMHLTGAEIKPLLPATADFAWSGEAASLSHFTLQALLGSTRVGAAGSASLRGLELTALDFAPGGTPALHLVRPLTLTWSGGLRLPAVDLSGGGAEIALTPEGDSVSLQVTRVPAAWISAVMPWTGPNFVAQSVGFTGHWSDGRLVFAAHGDVDLWLSDGLAKLTLVADGDGRRVRIREARIESGGELLASISGDLPGWWQERPPHVQFNVDQPMRLRADTAPNSPFWNALADTFGLALTAPQASLTASGTMRQPEGEFHLRIGSLSALPGRAPGRIPALQNLTVEVHADRSDVVLDHLTGSIAGRTVLAMGRMPMSAAEWTGLFARTRTQPWKDADATLAIGDSGLQALAPYLPSILAPRGHWSARFRYAHGSLEGAIHLRGLQLRPVAPLGLVQNINGDLTCHGRAVDITSLTAEVGGQIARVTGRIDLPAGKPPQFVLALQGSAIPLVRQANLLARADLDLKASTVENETRVTGTVKIVDGLMLGDLEDLLPSGLVGGGRPPPYFSVTAEPFARWHAQVALVADHALRIHTTLFNGEASAQFEILGELSDPRAVGELTIDQGSILLPFATFAVQAGAVRLEPDDPYHPRIDVVATARRYDYDLRMNVTGGADSPVLTFSSNPALPSDQILQLVMAGQMPQTGSLLAGSQTQVAGLGEYLGQGILSGFSGAGGSTRLSIQSGQELSVTGRPTYEIEYRLGKRWWLTGEYDVFDDYNAGLKWRIYTKGGKP